MGAERLSLVSLHCGMADSPWTELSMRLPRRMYWLADRIVGIVSDCEFGFLNKSDTVLVRRCVCAVEGCGLLADGQT